VAKNATDGNLHQPCGALIAASEARAREFGGYDCSDNCSGHAAGYRWAEAHSITTESDCPLRGGAISFTKVVWCTSTIPIGARMRMTMGMTLTIEVAPGSGFLARAARVFHALLIIAGAWAGCEVPRALAATDQDFDLACAVVSAAEVATTAPGSAERNTAFQIQFFYLGRLSGRDDQTYWSAVIKGRIAELKAKAKAPDLYGRCAEFVTKKIE
jgi:hypothetical protein